MNEEERDIEKESFKLQILTFFRLLVKLLIHLLALQMLCIYLEERNRICFLEWARVNFIIWVVLFFKHSFLSHRRSKRLLLFFYN